MAHHQSPSKRPPSPSLPCSSHHVMKKLRVASKFTPIKVATKEAAAAVDRDPPLPILLNAVAESISNPANGDSVLYWMRMGDLRISDNRALFQASVHAEKYRIPLVVLFVLSPQDYIAHDRSARRIDFTLRNLAHIRTLLKEFHIPLEVITHPVRKTLPSAIISYSNRIGAKALYANIEYEVDELRRDILICKLAQQEGVKATFIHDKCVVEPGVVLTKQNNVYTVFSPFLKNWVETVNSDEKYLVEINVPRQNGISIYHDKGFAAIFDTSVPKSLDGFELATQDKVKMEEIFPAGEEAARLALHGFMHSVACPSRLVPTNPLCTGTEETCKQSRITEYADARSRVDKDTSSRLSPYLAAGVISARACIRAAMSLRDSNKVDINRQTGPGVWVQEIAWRDFYINVLAACPRVSMGRPFLEKYADIVWEDYQEGGGLEEPEIEQHKTRLCDPDEAVKRWKEGTTGYPIVDAAMRCINEFGWAHNRLRMIVAMFLTKDLMIDWKVGERYFMQTLIDGDLAANNGGWQWSASTGTDAAPYFRIFNPYSQSLKADPSGDFIRHFVPELRPLHGNDIHNPPPDVADRLGYPRPIVQHDQARERALRRFKHPGQA